MGYYIIFNILPYVYTYLVWRYIVCLTNIGIIRGNKICNPGFVNRNTHIVSLLVVLKRNNFIVSSSLQKKYFSNVNF